MREISSILNDSVQSIINDGMPKGTIVGVGNDVVDVARIAALLQQTNEGFLHRCFTPEEIRDCRSSVHSDVRFAGRWAAKEAVYKALRLQWNRAFSWKEIEVLSSADRSPTVKLSAQISALYSGSSPPEILLSISHCDEYAFAVALAVRRAQNQ